jgi:hypothetical protein
MLDVALPAEALAEAGTLDFKNSLLNDTGSLVFSGLGFGSFGISVSLDID